MVFGVLGLASPIAALNLLLPFVSSLGPLASSFDGILFKDAAASYGAQTLQDPFPYDFPDQRMADSSHLFPMPLCQGIDIDEATIDTLQGHLSTGALTSQQLALCYLQRIWQTNDYIKSSLEVNPDFLEIAADLDAERRNGKIRGPLHGIPVSASEFGIIPSL